MIVAMTNSKGGVGKSTLAVHLAVWLHEQGSHVAIVDSDVQSSSSVWLHEAAPEIPVFRLPTADDVLDQVPTLKGEFDHLVADGPAGLSEVTRTLLFVADLTLLPCGPSVLDLRAANDAIRAVRQVQAIRGGFPRALLVPNKVQIQYRLSQEFLMTARALDVPATSALRLRQTYADAPGQATVVWRMGQRGTEAASEIRRLFEEVMTDERTKTHEASIANG